MTVPILRERRKAVLYVTSARHILVFSEPEHPEIGLQPPGGTIFEGEAIEAGAVRELVEETGLVVAERDLSLIGRRTYEYQLGDTLHRHHRHFFHVAVETDISRRWRMIEETPDGGSGPIALDLFWHRLDASLTFFADLDAFLPALIAPDEALPPS